MVVFSSLTTESLLAVDSTMSIITSDPMLDTNSTHSLVNHTTRQDNNDTLLSTAFVFFYLGVRLLFSGFAIFGNMLTIVAVIRYEQLQNTTNFLICSLAAADMLGGILTPMEAAHEILADYPIFVPLCLIDKTLNIISVGVNLISIMWIAIDRYIYIVHGLHYHSYVTRTRTFTVIGLTWLIFTTEVITVVMLTHDLKMGMICKFNVFLSSLGYNKILLPQIGMFTVVTVTFYIIIGHIAYKQGKAIAALNQPYDTYEAAMNRQQKKIAKMMATILGTYFTCYVPQVVLSIIVRSSRTIFWMRFEKITALIFWANTWLNPIIYAWKSEDFRIAFRKLLRLKPSTVNPSIENISDFDLSPAGNNTCSNI